MCKLYPAFGAAVVLWAALTLLFDGLTGGAAILRREALSVVLTALGVQTLVPGFDLPPVGPWWFLPFILQFYCLWPAIRWVTRRRGALGLWTLAGVGVAATFLLQPALARWDVALMETPLGHLPEICLGIAAARFGFAPGRWTALCSTGAFIVGNVYGPAWLLTFPAVTVLMLWSYGFVRRQVREWPLARQFGDISMPLFFVNGILRRPFLGVAQAFGAWYAGLIFGVLSLLFSAGAASLMQRRERGTRERAAAVQGATL
jgi:peptidoglycan/LPS O-acetylase OafA/YrhL